MIENKIARVFQNLASFKKTRNKYETKKQEDQSSKRNIQRILVPERNYRDNKGTNNIREILVIQEILFIQESFSRAKERCMSLNSPAKQNKNFLPDMSDGVFQNIKRSVECKNKTKNLEISGRRKSIQICSNEINQIKLEKEITGFNVI